MEQKIPAHILPTIIISQFFGTSLWFAGNAVAPDLIDSFGLPQGTVGYLTSSVQLGFIAGTLFFAVLSLADRFPAVRLFMVCSILSALFNLSMVLSESLYYFVSARFLTGFFLAGVYPVGMKISSDWYGKGLGKALGFLLGALVIGTAFPHLVRGLNAGYNWKAVIILTSAAAMLGGFLMLILVKEGPHRAQATRFKPSVVFQVFQYTNFRHAALGYFGHMWELYTFWAFVPFILARGNSKADPMLSFMVIAVGAIGCIVGGFISVRKGSSRVAWTALLISGICCFISPWISQLPTEIFLPVIFLWGIAVITDSPQFSTIIARTAPPELKGSALTIVNSIGFAITIPSIELLNYLQQHFSGLAVFAILGIGPAIGLIAMTPLAKQRI